MSASSITTADYLMDEHVDRILVNVSQFQGYDCCAQAPYLCLDLGRSSCAGDEVYSAERLGSLHPFTVVYALLYN